jgi:hypothetical protein
MEEDPGAGRFELKYPPPKCSQFCRQHISKSVIIGDVPIAIREWKGEGNCNRANCGRCHKTFIFQRLIARVNCLCYKEFTEKAAQKHSIGRF